MSQPHSSTDLFAVPTVTEEEMLGFLEEYCEKDVPPSPVQRLLEWLRDPFESDQELEAGNEGQKERYRLNPLCVSLGIFLLIAFANFIYFSFWSN